MDTIIREAVNGTLGRWMGGKYQLTIKPLVTQEIRESGSEKEEAQLKYVITRSDKMKSGYIEKRNRVNGNIRQLKEE